MIKVSVCYPDTEGEKFDMDYYCNTHAKLVSDTLGDALKGASYDRGLAGSAPRLPAICVAMANLYFDSIEAFGRAFDEAAPTFMADLQNLSTIEPVVRISDVMR